MKKILIYGITSTVGGIETYLINIIKNIDKSKIQIDLLVKENIEGQNRIGIEGNYNKINYIYPIKKHPIKAIKELIKLAKVGNYDILHINMCDSLPIIYAIPFKIFSKKTKIYIHSHNSSGSHKYLHIFFREIVKMIGSKYLACSDEAAQWMFGKKIFKNHKFILLPNFINTKDYLFNGKIRNKIRKELGINNKFVIGHVGRLSFAKNHKFLFDVVKELLKENKNIILISIGTGELKEELMQYTKDLGIEQNVLFLGVKQNVNEYYQAMDLFVLPSMFEGLPIVSIEAQASGLKCLISNKVDKKCNITGNVEFLSIYNLYLWKNRILKIINQPYERKNVETAIINNHYDLNNEIKVMENLYLEG